MTYPLDLLDPPGSGRVTPNPVPRAPEGTLRGDATSRNFWAAGPQGGASPAPSRHALVPVDGPRMVSGDRTAVPGTPYRPNFTIPQGELPPGVGRGPANMGPQLQPQAGTPANLSTGRTGFSPQAQDWMNGRTANTGPQPSTAMPSGSPLAPQGGSPLQQVAGSLRDLRSTDTYRQLVADPKLFSPSSAPAAPTASAPAAPAAPTGVVGKTLAGAKDLGSAAITKGSNAVVGASNFLAKNAPLIAAGQQAYSDAPQVLDSAKENGWGSLPTATRASELLARAGAAGAGAGVGANAGAMLGGLTSPVTGPVGPIVGGLVGGAAGAYYGPEAASAAIDKARSWLGVGSAGTPVGEAPAAPARPSYQADLRKADVGGTPQTPTAIPAQPGFTERSPGIFQRGKNEFSDAAGLRDASFWARGEISPQNMRAANAMDARYRAQASAAPGGSGGGSQYQREVEDANARNAAAAMIGANQRSILPGGGILSAEFQQQSNRESASRRMAEQAERRPGETAAAHNARVGMSKAIMERDQRETESVRGDGTARRGQDLGYSSTTRGQDLNHGATLRGQDMDLQGRVLPKQMEIQMQMAQRQRLADLTNGSRAAGPDGKPGAVDYTAAQQRALMMGDATSAEALGKMVSNVQGQTAAAQGIDDGFQKKLASRVAIPLMKDGQPTGQRNEVEEAAMVSQMMQSHPELNQLSPAQLNEALPKLLARQTLLQKYNKAGQDTGFGWRGEIIPSYNDQLPQLATEPAPGALSHLRPQREGFFNGIGADPNDVTLRGNAGSYNLGPLDALEAETLRGWTTPAAKK